MSVFRSEEGKNEIRKAVHNIYRRAPVPAESRMLDLGEFGDTHVMIAGPEGAMPLVLLHGTSNNSASWMDDLVSWSEEFRIFALDIPGQPGLSDDRRPSITNGTMGIWMERAIEALGLGRFFLCGRSLGGLIALDYTANHSEKIEALCLYSPGGLAPPKIGFFFRVLPLYFMGRYGARKINQIIHGPVPVIPQVEELALLVSRYFKPVTEKIPELTDEQLGRIDVPVLYIGGEQDVLLRTRESAERLSETVPDTTIHILDQLGHVIVDQTETVKEFLLQVTDRHPARTSA